MHLCAAIVHFRVMSIRPRVQCQCVFLHPCFGLGRKFRSDAGHGRLHHSDQWLSSEGGVCRG